MQTYKKKTLPSIPQASTSPTAAPQVGRYNMSISNKKNKEPSGLSWWNTDTVWRVNFRQTMYITPASSSTSAHVTWTDALLLAQELYPSLKMKRRKIFKKKKTIRFQDQITRFHVTVNNWRNGQKKAHGYQCFYLRRSAGGNWRLGLQDNKGSSSSVVFRVDEPIITASDNVSGDQWASALYW